jgi:hypothetical protein
VRRRIGRRTDNGGCVRLLGIACENTHSAEITHDRPRRGAHAVRISRRARFRNLSNVRRSRVREAAGALFRYSPDPTLEDMLMRQFKLSIALAAVAATTVSFAALAGETVCRGSIGQRTLDNIFVPDNATCTLDRTRAIGTVKVGRGATLLANRVRINGDVQAEGATQVSIGAGSQVSGSVQIKQGGGASVAGVRIAGDLPFDGNVLPLLAVGNAIGGNLQAVKNFGGLSITDNVIDGALQCKENAPSPVGGGNSASSKEGQCSAL